MSCSERVGLVRVEEAFRAIKAILEDAEAQEALARASEGAQRKVEEILRRFPELEAMAVELRRAKARVIDRLEEYVERAVEALRKVGARPYVAGSPGEALEIMGSLVGSGRIVVMSKSMALEEIGAREYLEGLGNEVWETDLGQLLVMLEEGKPMHPVAPAVHLSRRRAIRLLRERLGLELEESTSVEDAVAKVREFLREKFQRASHGVTGANALAADTGSLVLVENEGNIRLVTGLPRVHIAVVPVDKILPTLREAIVQALVQSAYAGLYPPTYLTVVSGPSSTADIGHERVYGAHGPRELHVILLDNGRIEATRNQALREQLFCIRCGRCLFECPVWVHTGNHWGGRVYGGPMGLVWTAITEDPGLAAAMSYLCLQCGRCDEACPVKIPLSSLIRRLKSPKAGGLQ